MVGKESEPASGVGDETSRYVRNSAHLPHLLDPWATEEGATLTWQGADDLDPAEVDDPEPDVVVDLRQATSRYERRSGALPHLTDDPEWVAPTTGLPQPIRDEKPRRFRRLRRPFRRR